VRGGSSNASIRNGFFKSCARAFELFSSHCLEAIEASIVNTRAVAEFSLAVQSS
jgi:hypothetical protein